MGELTRSIETMADEGSYQYRLTLRIGLRAVSHWDVGPHPMVIGRAPNCDIRLMDPWASKRTCTVRASNGGLHISDISATNPLLINGEKAAKDMLVPGDVLTIGKSRLHTEALPRFEDSVDALQTLPVQDSELLADSSMMTSALPKDGGTEQARLKLLSLARGLPLCPDAESAIEEIYEVVSEARYVLKAWVWYAPPGIRAVWRTPGDAGQAVPEHISSEAILAASRNAGMVRQANHSNSNSKTLCSPLVCGEERVGAIVCEVDPLADDKPIFDLLQFITAVGVVSGPPLWLLAQLQSLRDTAAGIRQHVNYANYNIIGSSDEITHVRERIPAIAQSRSAVLIQGETGTGKELIAQAIHRQSSLAKAPLLILNCAAVPEELFDSEFFGHVRGAFTGAINDRIGLFQRANGGTLFLDEIAELSLQNQAKLLRALESGEARKVGSNETEVVDTRLIAATSIDLDEASTTGEFRAELLYRIRGFMVTLPPLRDRISDIPMLAQEFVMKHAEKYSLAPKKIAPDALELLASHDWPGNIRELRSTVESAFALAKTKISAKHIEEAIYRKPRSGSLTKLEDVERDHIRTVLQSTNGSVSQAAQALGIAKSTLYAKLKEYEE